MIGRVDEFVLFDDVQFTRRDWRNRNTIKTKDGLRWLTIPVAVKGKYFQKINETDISDPSWREAHLTAIRHSYARAPHFREVFPWLERLFARLTAARLSDVNRTALEAICERLEIATRITSSSDYGLVEGKNERLIELCAQAGATRYLSGPAARGYLDEGAFRARGIEVEWMDYSGYPEYPQLFPPFEHNVSVLDVLFNTGPDAASYVRRS